MKEKDVPMTRDAAITALVEKYTWRVGDVFANGEHRWKVISVDGERAILQSCASSFATTIPLTFNEWHEGGRWKLEAVSGRMPPCKTCGHRWGDHAMDGSIEDIDVDNGRRPCFEGDCRCRDYQEPSR